MTDIPHPVATGSLWCNECRGSGLAEVYVGHGSIDLVACDACGGTGIPDKPTSRTCNTCEYFLPRQSECCLCVDELATRSDGKTVRINGEECPNYSGNPEE